MAKQYKVTVKLPSSTKATKRIRAGIAVSREHGYTGPLTDEQLEAITADHHMTVEGIEAEDEEVGKSIDRMNRAELDAVALDEGVDSSQYKSKKDLLEAIKAKRAEAESQDDN